MNFARNIVVSLLVVVFAVSFASARENLSVLVAFDKTTTNYNTSSKRYKKAKELVSKLNQSFINSGLSNKVYFYLKSYGNIKISFPRQSYNFIRYAIDNSKPFYSRKPVGDLQKMQRKYKADVVLAIVKPYNYNSNGKICGKARIPRKSDNRYSTASKLQHADYSIVLLTDDSECYGWSENVAHEVGHSFGLHHGKFAGDYDSSQILDKRAAGYGESHFANKYWTLMNPHRVMLGGYIHNRFSDSSRNDCGQHVWNNNPCGNSNADATSFMKNYFYDYNKRGNWYRGFDGVKII